MKALIIGAAGFVGGYLIDILNEKNFDVYATKLPYENIQSDVKVYNLDLFDFAAICSLLDKIKPDVIFHLAAQSSVQVSWSKPQLTANVNIIGAINLFEAVRAKCLSAKVLAIGSSEEYGDIDYSNAVNEEVVPEPKNIYALTKFTQEQLARIYVQAYGLRISMTRSFNHIGPRQSVRFVVADLCNQVACIERGERSPLISIGNLSSYRDFSDVRDVVRAYVLLAEKGIDGEVYNVGSGKAVQIKEILDLILSLAKTKIAVKDDPAKFRPIDIPRIEADISKIKNIGWSPEIPLKQSVLDTLDYYRRV